MLGFCDDNAKNRGQAPVPRLKISNLHVYSLICQCKGIAAKKTEPHRGDEAPFLGDCPAEIAEIAEMFHGRSLS